MKTTPIAKLGEFKLIEHLTKNIKGKDVSVVQGIGDDAAVIDLGGRYQLLSTDMLIEGVHFDLSYTPLKHLGYKSVSVNVSDICAMNSVPKQIVIGLAISNRFSVESLEEFYEGVNLACQKYNIDLVGGDTTSSTSGLIISVSILGQGLKEKVTFRNGAQIDDLLVVSGDLGGAYLGLQILKREKEIFLQNPKIQPELQGYDYVLGRQLKPEARTDIIIELDQLHIKPTSMIDISDGLSSEALHISKSSNVGVHIYEEKIPIDAQSLILAEELNINPSLCALNGGEDYELLFTIKQKEYKKIKSNIKFSVIGHISDINEGNNFIANDDSVHPLMAQGWDSLQL